MPLQPIRQWVLSVPFPLRFLFASQPAVMGKVLAIIYRTIVTHLAYKAGYTKTMAQTGAVTLIHRISKQDHAAHRSSGEKNQCQQRTEAMIAAFESNPDGVIAALKSAMQRGVRDQQFFTDLIFEDLWNEPRFVALQRELDAILDAEHNKILQLIYFNNTPPGNWQPLPETCESVVKQTVFPPRKWFGQCPGAAGRNRCCN